MSKLKVCSAASSSDVIGLDSAGAFAALASSHSRRYVRGSQRLWRARAADARRQQEGNDGALRRCSLRDLRIAAARLSIVLPLPTR